MESSDRVWRERSLRKAVLAGDEQAWRAWYDEAFAGLAAYVRWRCGGLRDVADDLVQETWLTAVKRIRQFDPEQAPFSGWLRGIAANLLRNRFRKEERRNGFLPPQSAKSGGAPDAELTRRENAERIGRALTSLPEHYEAVLRAKYLDGQNVADIAAAGGETPKAIESLLTRAREAFREAYGPREDAS
jgi:RNA polymerase sigma-70 factor (ECF subfamily)